MIDIHSHLLPNVDDGSDDLATSLEILSEISKQGVTDMILTPHYRGKCKGQLNLLEKFCSFKEQAKQNKIDVNLYLGREIYIEKDYKQVIEQEEFSTLNGTKYVLIEFDPVREKDVVNVVYDIVKSGYVPVVAHFERCEYVDIDEAYGIKDAGGLVQVNANSIVGNSLHARSRFVDRLFKECLVDFVASDVHVGRQCLMKKAYYKVLNKYGEDAANAVFYYNAKQIIQGQS